MFIKIYEKTNKKKQIGFYLEPGVVGDCGSEEVVGDPGGRSGPADIVPRHVINILPDYTLS